MNRPGGGCCSSASAPRLRDTACCSTRSCRAVSGRACCGRPASCAPRSARSRTTSSGTPAGSSETARSSRAGCIRARSRTTARVFGAVGPAQRGSRGERDVRTFAPYGAYRRLAVHVASHAGGDVFARCSVKRDELSESFRLVEEALQTLDDADPASANAVVELAPASGTALAAVEGPRGAETLAVHLDGSGRIERLHAIST